MKLKIEGMSCQHCVAAVRDALTDVEGVVQMAAVDLDSGMAEVEGNPDAATLIAAVQAEGYSAELAS